MCAAERERAYDRVSQEISWRLFFCPLVEIIFILDPTHRVNFPPKGETTDLPDQREKLPGLCHPGYQTGLGGGNQVAKHLIQPFFGYTKLRIIIIFLARNEKESLSKCF